MLDLKRISANPELLRTNFKKRHLMDQTDFILGLYNKHKATQAQLDEWRTKKNVLVKERCSDVELMKNINASIAKLNAESESLRFQLNDVVHSVPNLLDNTDLQDEDSVLEVSSAQLDAVSQDHESIAKAMGCWERDKAVAMSGSRFVLYTGALAKLERVLVNWLLESNTSANYLEASVPFVVQKQAMYNTGQFPKFAEDVFVSSDYALIPTGEIPLMNMYANCMLSEKDLSIMLTAHTPCFRKEVGALGKDTKGLKRLHQFSKVELGIICTPSESERMHKLMVSHVVGLVKQLELPYRIVQVGSKNIGFSAALQFDVEVWMPGLQQYMEVSSISNCMDFQACRMNTKYKDTNNKKHYVHTLNGSALPLGRIIAAILENHTSDGVLTFPKCLVEFDTSLPAQFVFSS